MDVHDGILCVHGITVPIIYLLYLWSRKSPLYRSFAMAAYLLVDGIEAQRTPISSHWYAAFHITRTGPSSITLQRPNQSGMTNRVLRDIG